MRLTLFLLCVPLTGALTQAPAVEMPGRMLQAGTVLVYSSNGAENPWTVHAFNGDTAVGAMTGCASLRLQMGPAAPQITRRFCVDTAFVWAWNERDAQLRTARPIRPRGNLSSYSSTTRNVTEYRSDAMAVDTVGGVAIPVIPTVVITRDSSGRVLRRLRERFSLGLLTATSGVFEVPDSTRAGGWRTEQAFELVAIRNPR